MNIFATILFVWYNLVTKVFVFFNPGNRKKVVTLQVNLFTRNALYLLLFFTCVCVIVCV